MYLGGELYLKPNREYGKNGAAVVDKSGKIYINTSVSQTPDEWAFIIAHCLLHLAFGHFDDEKIPRDEHGSFSPAQWNKACDIYITRFLYDIAFGNPVCDDPAAAFSIKLNDEQKIYEHLFLGPEESSLLYSTNGTKPDMLGMEHPIVYKSGEKNEFAESFSFALNHSVSQAVHHAGGYTDEKKNTIITKVTNWFLTHYPLLGGLAASFKILEDIDLCYKYEIHIAAVDISIGEIYVNPAAKLSEEEWKFVLAHEFLHAGLQHNKRCQGRDKYLWNISCDYIINDFFYALSIAQANDTSCRWLANFRKTFLSVKGK